MKTLLILILCANVAMADSSLTFGALTTDNVSHGSGTSIDNLNTKTVLMWVYPTTLTAGRLLYVKSGDADGFNRFVLSVAGTEDELRLIMTDSGTQYRTNNANLTVNNWWFVGFTYTDSGTGRVKIYSGSATSPATALTFSLATDGTGSYLSDAAQNLTIGNGDSAGGGGTTPWQGQIGWVGVWNRVLTLAEIQDQQFNPHITSGNVLFVHEGFNGTGTQYDLSGNGNNGTVTGATGSTNGPPIFLPGGPT